MNGGFRYDLDGDGTGEIYKLGIYQENVPEGFRDSLSDNFFPQEGEAYQRNVYPAFGGAWTTAPCSLRWSLQSC